jgi:hypothetical protein
LLVFVTQFFAVVTPKAIAAWFGAEEATASGTVFAVNDHAQL